MVPRKPFTVCLCIFGISLLLIIGGFVCLFAWPLLYNHIIDSQTILKPNSFTFNMWKQFPFPLHIDFYLFNWTNPEDVNNASVKMKFTQMGPYRFREVKDKDNITWNDNNGTISYRQKSEWYHDVHEQFSNLDDPVTTLNPITLTASHKARSWGYFTKKGLSISMSSAKIHVTKSVRQFLFDGYRDPFLDLGRSMPFLAGLPPWDKFGWFYGRNGTNDFDGHFNMGTGQTAAAEYGKLYKWNHKDTVPYLPGKCNQLDTQSGQLFPRNPPKSKLVIFSSDICRDMQLDYVGETTVNNILGYKYVMADSSLDNGTLIPGNECYCNGDCMPSGVVNVSSCRYGSPAFGSLPHFYNADPVYLESIEGLKPEKEKHEFYMILEPNTGIPLEVSVRLQINMHLQPIPAIGMYENVRSTMVPMIWFEQRIILPSDLIFSLKFLLNLPVIFTATGIICISLGLLLIMCTIYKACTSNMCGRRKDTMIFNEQCVPLKPTRSREMIIMN